MTQRRGGHQFASDNTAGICPEALAAIQKVNSGTAPAYGEDDLTHRLCDRLREIFETDCDVYLVFSGTAANALALAQLCQPFHSVFCHKLAHIHTDECGAPEFFTNGSKLLLVDGGNGKISLQEVKQILRAQQGVHSHKPHVLSVTQATELGTVYSADEIRETCEFAHSHDLLVHMDGARLANALAFVGCAPKELTWKAGVDVLCFGGTKNGIAAGELVIFFRRELSRDFDYRLKQAGQLGSKMRFSAAQWLGLLTNDAWLRNARHANECARRLADRLSRTANLQPLVPIESNAVFLRLPERLSAGLLERGWSFYSFVEPNVYRLMCSWATAEDDIAQLVTDAEALIAKS